MYLHVQAISLLPHTVADSELSLAVAGMLSPSMRGHRGSNFAPTEKFCLRSAPMLCFHSGPSGALRYEGRLLLAAHASSKIIYLLGDGLGNARIPHGEPSRRAPLILGFACATRGHTCIWTVIILFSIVNVLHCHNTLCLFPCLRSIILVLCCTGWAHFYAIAQGQQPFTGDVLPLPCTTHGGQALVLP